MVFCAQMFWALLTWKPSSVGCVYHLTTEPIASALHINAHILVLACISQFLVFPFVPVCNKIQPTFLNIRPQRLFPSDLRLSSVPSFEVCVLHLVHLWKSFVWYYVFFPGSQGILWKFLNDYFWTNDEISWCYYFPCRFQTGQLSYEAIFINSICQSFLKENVILWAVDYNHDLPSILIIWTIILQLLWLVLLKVLSTPQIFSPCEYIFETYKEDIRYKQFIQRSKPTGRGLPCPTTICNYLCLSFSN